MRKCMRPKPRAWKTMRWAQTKQITARHNKQSPFRKAVWDFRSASTSATRTFCENCFRKFRQKSKKNESIVRLQTRIHSLFLQIFAQLIADEEDLRMQVETSPSKTFTGEKRNARLRLFLLPVWLISFKQTAHWRLRRSRRAPPPIH